MGDVTFEHHLLKEAGTSPNNGALPLIVYRSVMDVGGDEPEAAVERPLRRQRLGRRLSRRHLSLPPLPLDRTRGRGLRARCGAAPVRRARGAGGRRSGGRCRADPRRGGPLPARRQTRATSASAPIRRASSRTSACCPTRMRRSPARGRDTEGLELKVVGEAEMPAIRASIASVPLPATDPLAAGSGPVESLWLEG